MNIDVRRLPEIAFLHRAPLFWAAMGIIFIEGTMFVLLMSTYYYVRVNVDVWPPPGTQMPHIMLPTIELIVLLLSCLPAYWASEAAKRNDSAGIARNLVYNGGLAILALVLRVIYWLTFNFNWKTDIHGSVVWMIMTLHTFETVSAIIVTAFLLVLLALGRFTDTHRKGVDFDSITWYFLVGIWVLLYATIFIAPHILQSS